MYSPLPPPRRSLVAVGDDAAKPLASVGQERGVPGTATPNADITGSTGGFRTVILDEERQLYGFERFAGTERLLVVLKHYTEFIDSAEIFGDSRTRSSNVSSTSVDPVFWKANSTQPAK